MNGVLINSDKLFTCKFEVNRCHVTAFVLYFINPYFDLTVYLIFTWCHITAFVLYLINPYFDLTVYLIFTSGHLHALTSCVWLSHIGIWLGSHTDHKHT